MEVEGVYLEVKRWRWRLKGCNFRLMWRKWRLRGCSLRLWGCRWRLRGSGGGGGGLGGVV